MQPQDLVTFQSTVHFSAYRRSLESNAIPPLQQLRLGPRWLISKTHQFNRKVKNEVISMWWDLKRSMLKVIKSNVVNENRWGEKSSTKMQETVTL